MSRSLLLVAALAVTLAGTGAGQSPFTPGCPLPLQLRDLAPATDGLQSCGNTGDAERLSDQRQNEVKNNFCATGDPIPVNFATLRKLQERSDKNKVGHPEDRSILKNLIKENGVSIGEGAVVRLVAFLHSAHFTRSKETSTCHEGAQARKDIHIDLLSKKGADPCQSVTAEMIPHFRPEAWIGMTELEDLEFPVRITGQLFYDSSHVPCRNGSKASPARASVWEIHPVYAVDVCVNKSLQTCPVKDETKWKPLHQWLEENPEVDQ